MNDDTDAFWKDVLGRVARARTPATVSLEEAERRMAEAEEAPLPAADIDRMVAAATGGGAPRQGRVVRFPHWRRKAAAAALILVPLLAVAFWKAFDQKPPGPHEDSGYVEAVRRITDREAVTEAARALPGALDLEAQTNRLAQVALGHTASLIQHGITKLRELGQQPGVLGERALAHLRDLEPVLDGAADHRTPRVDRSLLALIDGVLDVNRSTEARLQDLDVLAQHMQDGIVAIRRMDAHGHRRTELSIPIFLQQIRNALRQ